MNIKIWPHLLQGEVPAIPSKSHGHRLLICAALAGAMETVQVDIPSQDILATRECLDRLRDPDPVLDCRESGSTLRFLLPIVMTGSHRATFLRKGRLKDRPLSPLKEEMEAHGCTFREDPQGKLFVTGPMRGGEFSLPGNVSSQFITGLLMALPLLPSGGHVRLTTPLQSAPYVDLTLQVLEEFGISVEVDDRTYTVAGNQSYISPGSRQAEGDWSNAAFFLTASSLGSSVTCTGLDQGSKQGDKAIVPLLSRMDREEYRQIDASQIPDLVPILAVKAALTPGTTRITNAERLRIKESDRLQVMAHNISTLGGDIRILPDGLLIQGGSLKGGEVDGAGDHRIVMSMAIAATRCQGPVTILGAEAVDKSYPTFFDEFRRLGGVIDEVEPR
ncbi:MAG: 3-phosphoshikimate 1-carboxyvinyltransferase [Anaerovoracaceae bacterium]|jgi:3-phosphoshikimate 1-carboxyvinyltransferase